MNFYRYEMVRHASKDYFGEYSGDYTISVVLNTYVLFKETPKGYWIGFGNLNGLHGDKKWVSKTSVKRYAYPTKEKAMNNFILRSEKRVKILQTQVSDVKSALSRAEQMKEIGL